MAQWLEKKEPTFLSSLWGYTRDRTIKLLDGAYFGLNGQDVVSVDTVGWLHNFSWEWQKIVWDNPGLKKRSRFINTSVHGSTLFAFIDWKWWIQIEHIEAQNEKLVREVSYPDAFKYIGRTWTADFIAEILKSKTRREKAGETFGISPDELLEVFSQSVYQVLWIWHERLIISDFDIDRPDPGPIGMQYRI